jgi:serine/threonine-protein kinase HipA
MMARFSLATGLRETVDVPGGFTHYLVKFDGVSEHSQEQQSFGDPLGYGVMEYVYYQIAQQCGIDMMPCRLLQEGSRRHFITGRFDRIGNEKIHIQTLNGIAHVDYRKPGSFSYAELFGVSRKLTLPASAAEQLMRRLVFNIVARNHNDHSKIFAFMLQHGKWALAPAYDIAYSYRPGNKWINSHWMTLNDKREDFTREDFHSLASLSPIFTNKKIDKIIAETKEQVSQWGRLAKAQELPEQFIERVQSNLRLDL